MRSHIHTLSLSTLRRGLLGLGLGLVVLAATGTATARGATLRWKFRPGEQLHYTMDQKTVTTAKLPGGQEIKTTMSQTIEMTWAVQGVDASGLAEMTQTIDRIRDQIEGPVGSYTYDSKDGKEPEALLAATRVPLFKALLGAPIAFKMSPRGEPSDVRVPEKVKQTLGELGNAAAGAGALFSEEGLKEMITQASLIVPPDDLTAGKTWTRQARNVVPALGTVVIESTYRYDGPAPNAGPDAVRIGLANKVEIQPPAEADANANAKANANADANANPNPLKVRSQKSQGTSTFDNAAGHLLDSNLSEVLEVGIMFKVGAGTAARTMEVVQTTETTTIRKLVKDEKANPGR